MELAEALGWPNEEVFKWLVGGLKPSESGGELVKQLIRVLDHYANCVVLEDREDVTIK